MTTLDQIKKFIDISHFYYWRKFQQSCAERVSTIFFQVDVYKLISKIKFIVLIFGSVIGLDFYFLL